MPPVEDESLAGSTPTPADAALAPEGFDLQGWLSGVKPARRTVTVYGRADLLAEAEQLRWHLSLASGDDKAEIAAQLEATLEQIRASAADFIIEGRTSTWLETIHQGFEAQKIEDKVERGLRQLAMQIVSPQITYAELSELAKLREPDVVRMLEVATELNSQPIGVTPGFLLGASG